MRGPECRQRPPGKVRRTVLQRAVVSTSGSGGARVRRQRGASPWCSSCSSSRWCSTSRWPETLLDIDHAADLEPPVTSPPEVTELSAEQRSVAGQAGLDGVRFVWGPPGTGKTATLAATIRMLLQQGKRVCVLAHADAAVDVAKLRAMACAPRRCSSSTSVCRRRRRWRGPSARRSCGSADPRRNPPHPLRPLLGGRQRAA